MADKASHTLLQVGLMLSKLETLYGAIFKRRGTLYDLSAGRGLLLFAAFLQVSHATSLTRQCYVTAMSLTRR